MYETKCRKFDILCFCFQIKRQYKFTGVYFNKKSSKYKGQITHKRKIYHCGSYLTELEAAQATNAKCVELDIPLQNPEAGLPENKTEVSFVSYKLT